MAKFSSHDAPVETGRGGDPERRSEAAQLYRGIFANLPQPLVIVRMEAAHPGLSPHIVDLNRAAREISSNPAADLQGETVADCFPGLLDAGFAEACLKTRQTGSRSDAGEVSGAGSAPYRAQVFPLFGDYLGVTLSGTSDESRTEEALSSLRESEAKFRSTFEGAGIGIALVDRDGRLSQSNPALQGLLGYGAGELAGRSFLSFTHPEDASRDLALYRELMAGKRERYQMEKRLIRKDGEAIWVLLTATLVRGAKEGARYAVGMVEDITERKLGESKVAQLLARVQQDASELERRVEERTEQLQENNEELDTFAYSVSHDLRVPLRAIVSFAEILLENREKASDPERGEFLGRIIVAARDMDQLIQDLLAYSRLSRQEILLHTVSLDEVVREAARQLDQEGMDGSYRLQIVGTLPNARGNHAVLVQVVLNLLSNGVKYVAPGVTPELRIWAEPAKDRVRLYVQDNGIGIAPEHQERIFRVFERLHGVEAYQGSGVGLAIARKAVTRLGGRIGVESRLGEGSRFWIELPDGDR